MSHISEFGREFWRRLNLADRLAFAAVLTYALLALFGPAQARIPGLGIFRLLIIIPASYLVIRGMLWTRAHWPPWQRLPFRPAMQTYPILRTTI